ncbi:hypothetical protein ACIRS1_19655 [Kitasatospora sp. NPDC101176]|uniref:hypothetical protein n=1 Tax=Kitasatospora sp. NPDC101176 TaxID=3364099 RepID=UPI00382F0D2B
MADTTDGIDGTLRRIEARLTTRARTMIEDRARLPLGAPAPAPTDAQALDILRSRLEIARYAHNEVRQGGLISDGNPDLHLTALADYVAELHARITETETTGAPVAQLRTRLQQWSNAAGLECSTLVAALVESLVGRERDRTAAAAAAAQALAARQAAARQPRVRTDEEILQDAIRRKRGEAGPGYDPAARRLPGDVKSVLVVNGAEYHGSNGRSEKLSAVTLALVPQLVDRQEKWTETGCAEVSALDRFLVAAGHTTVAAAKTAIDRGALRGALIGTVCLYDRSANNPGTWEVRMPCPQCRQWLALAGIVAYDKDARS